MNFVTRSHSARSQGHCRDLARPGLGTDRERAFTFDNEEKEQSE